MTGNSERSALILSVGFIAGILILAFSIGINTKRLSKSLEKAGSNARSHSSTSFPSSLKIQTTESAKDLTLDRKKELADAFIAACAGNEYEGKKIQDVEIKIMESSSFGDRLEINGNLIFEDGSIYEDFESNLNTDGFGGYNGYVRTKDHTKLIIKDINIQ